MVAPEAKEAAGKRAHTRVVSLPGNLDVLCHDSAGAEYTLRWIHSEIYDEGAYNSFASQLEDGAVVFDVGANYGLYTIFTAQNGPDKLTVHAFEPVPPVADYCRANVGLYGLKDFTLHEVAIADKPGELDITYYPDCSVSSTIGQAEKKEGAISKDKERINTTVDFMKRIQFGRARFDYYFMKMMPSFVQRWCLEFFTKEKMKNKEVFKVPVKTISDMIRETKVEKIDLLKVDIEGHEYPALKGIEDKHWPMIKRVQLDLEDNHEEVLELLHSKGFKTREYVSECTVYDNQKNVEAWRE